jgi:arylsulfatase A-like enzyme
MGLALARLLLAGAALGALEVALVLATRMDLFLGAELGRYALFACSAWAAACAALGVLARGAALGLGRGVDPCGPRHRRRIRALAFVLVLPLATSALWLLTAGRRAREIPGRPALVFLAACLSAAAAAWIAGALLRRERSAPWLAAVPFAIAAVALALDQRVLVRLYQPFHLGLELLALCAAASGAALFQWPRAARTHVGLATWLLLAGLAGFQARSFSHAPNLRFAIAQSAPLSARWLQAFRTRASPTTSTPVATSALPHASAASGIDLRGRDVLLLTIDALRADRLRAYGGHGLTPALDALAADSIVFQRAYTATPHTSYALSSLMTAKYMQPLLAISDTATVHATLPQLLRRHGYRTAAFYPPSIFFVDGERFEWLRRDQIGFEYAKAMFAPAAERVPQLEEYLRTVEPGHPLFVWVHLFEPHEPYDPPPAFTRGDSPEARYDGEVAAADAAAGELIAKFRAARPAATVIVSADHGEEFGDHGGRHHGTTLFDEQVRVPLLWSSPGKTRPASVDVPVELIDVPTTLLSALGIPRDARMRGDDLGPLLAGRTHWPELRAFASIDGARMLTDGHEKLVCGDSECQLFDLVADPRERRDLADLRPARVAALRAELEQLVVSIPRMEALAMAGGGAWPEALARARLGDATAVPELLPLLAAQRVDVRAAAARAAGELRAAPALDALDSLRKSDSDVTVRAEAAIAALRLGHTDALQQVKALLPREASEAGELAELAALALSTANDRSGQGVLISVASDRRLEEPRRVAAIRALGAVGDVSAATALQGLLDDVRLRGEVAGALARIGGPGAIHALEDAFEHERYPSPRSAEARALLVLGDKRRAVALLIRFLGTESALPDGVSLLLAAGALSPPSGAGADLRLARSLRRGPWDCAAAGCRPLPGAALALPALRAPVGPVRLVLCARVDSGTGLLRVGDDSLELSVGASEGGVTLPPAHGPRVVTLDADPGVSLVAVAVVPVRADIPAPPPEPWQPDDRGVTRLPARRE